METTGSEDSNRRGGESSINDVIEEELESSLQVTLEKTEVMWICGSMSRK